MRGTKRFQEVAEILDRIFTSKQGCQMVCFQTKNPNFGKIWRALE
jgi:hypothetical protein